MPGNRRQNRKHSGLNTMSWKDLYKSIVFAALFVCLTFGAAQAERIREHVTIQIVPCCDVITTFKKFNPLLTYLKNVTGFDMDIITPKDYSEFEWAVKNKGSFSHCVGSIGYTDADTAYRQEKGYHHHWN